MHLIITYQPDFRTKLKVVKSQKFMQASLEYSLKYTVLESWGQFH